MAAPAFSILYLASAVGNDRAALETADLAFVCVPKGARSTLRQQGLALNGLAVHATLEKAAEARREGERILAFDAGARAGEHVAPEAFANLDPYRKPKSVLAGGGLVVRPGAEAPEVLLIFRRGAWDLPKGKLDPGETLSECALREVREEVGIRRLALAASAGFTVHGYPEKERYMVKRTAWYFMHTPERQFTPEAREGIEQVAWVPWPEAVERVGYDSLRRHLARLAEAAARAAG